MMAEGDGEVKREAVEAGAGGAGGRPTGAREPAGEEVAGEELAGGLRPAARSSRRSGLRALARAHLAAPGDGGSGRQAAGDGGPEARRRRRGGGNAGAHPQRDLGLHGGIARVGRRPLAGSRERAQDLRATRQGGCRRTGPGQHASLGLDTDRGTGARRVTLRTPAADASAAPGPPRLPARKNPGSDLSERPGGGALRHFPCTSARQGPDRPDHSPLRGEEGALTARTDRLGHGGYGVPGTRSRSTRRHPAPSRTSLWWNCATPARTCCCARGGSCCHS